MFTGEFDYTVSSTDEEHYNRINCCLTAPITKYCSITVTALTAKCSIVVLNVDDYIMINGKQHSLKNDFVDMNLDSYAGYMNNYFKEHDIDIQYDLDEAQRFVIKSSKPFVIERATYYIQLLMGLYNTTFPIYSDSMNNGYGIEYYIRVNSVGFNLSTPILYLSSNVGLQSYRNDINKDTSMKGCKIVMRISNSFNTGYPIIVNNADFTTTILSNDLSSLEFTLIDGFMKEVKLLLPMYLSIHVSGIKDDEVITDAQMHITSNGQK